MRNLKKLVALIVTIAMIATLTVTAFAAPADVAGTEYEGAVARLIALGVIAGYPDGTFKPEGEITRAEFATVVVKALGLADVADYSKAANKFSDVKATDWFAGFVNVAASQGIIKGYGDGKFGPNNKVLFEEAVTMIVRALGQDKIAESKGGYPAGFLIQAKSIGFTKDVKGVAGMPAPRGIVALLVDNAKAAKIFVQSGFGATETWVEGTDTFLTLLGMDDLATGVIVTEVVSDVKFKVGATEYTAVAGAVDTASLLGKKVNLWGSAADKVVLAEVVAGTDVVVATVDEYVVADSVYKVTLADGTKKSYKVAAGAGAVENLEVAAVNTALTNLVGKVADKVKVNFVVNSDDQVQFVSSVIFNEDAIAVAAVENKVAKSIKLGAYYIKQNDKAIKGLVIEKDGAMVDYTAIAKDDILFIAENFGTDNANCDDDYLYIKATSKTVAGTLEAAKPSLAAATSIKVEGTWYDVSKFLANIDASANIGKEITLTLDPAGKAYSIAGPTVTTDAGYSVIVAKGTQTDIYGVASYKVKVLTSAGDTVEYSAVDLATYNAVIVNRLAKITLNADGKISAVTMNDGTVVDNSLDTSKLRFASYDVDASAVLFYEKADGTFAKIAFADIKDDQKANAAIMLDGTTVKAMLFDYNAARLAAVGPVAGYEPAVTTGNYAYVTDYTALSSSYLMDVITKDGAKSLETTTAVYEAKGVLMSYEVNASGKISTLVAQTNDADDDTITAIAGDKITVKDAGGSTQSFWFTADSMVIYDDGARDGGASLLTKADVYTDMVVDVIADGNNDIIAVIISAM